jgi:hypothetical protein
MPPKRKQPEQPLDQGQFFPVDISREHPAEIGDVVEGGVFPEDLPPTEESAELRHFHEMVHEQVVAEQKIRKHRQAQLGKHSPLERDGTYLALRPGDVLYDGEKRVIVTDSNWDVAYELAERLEAERVAKHQAQPSLLGPGQEVVMSAGASNADALDIRNGLVDTLPGIPPQDRDLANTQIKLEGLKDDVRAGFLPTTHREKSQGYELLDYMKPGKYERGLSARLDQIFYHQQSDMREKRGMLPREALEVANDTVRSIIREWGDYYANARSSWVKLNALGKLVDGPNPELTMETLLDDENTGEVVTQLVRFNALRQLRDTDEPLGFDPLWVREDRSQPTDEKHKTVEDMFTHQNEEFMAAYVRRRAQQMSVGEARRAILEAKHDQANRGMFWRRNLESLAEEYQEYAQLALQPAA